MKLKLVSIRLECGGCPTNYTGKTVDGKQVEMYLRHGNLWIDVDGRRIVHENAGELDGVCSLDDFKNYAFRNGYILDTEDATRTSKLQEFEETIQKLYADKVSVTFTEDFYSPSTNLDFKKGRKYTTSLEGAETLVKIGLGVIESEHDQEKYRKYVSGREATQK
jgi:hypothetical protein